MEELYARSHYYELLVYAFQSGHVLMLVLDKFWNLIGQRVVRYRVVRARRVRRTHIEPL